ncbi:hypothetical protein L585_15835 [Pantoea ananatis BRT175]|nr:hypothetical protein L585_15835 [Pantoea ananatis BRT175]
MKAGFMKKPMSDNTRVKRWLPLILLVFRMQVE